MNNIMFGNVMPWFIDPTYLMEWLELAMIAVLVLTITGIIYAGLHFFLSNQTYFRFVKSKQERSSDLVTGHEQRLALSLPSNINIQEDE
ncbi:MAG: hypothetical protein ABW139_10045 [Candidatus Thiodiazotropha sp. DIVDIV]